MRKKLVKRNLWKQLKQKIETGFGETWLGIVMIVLVVLVRFTGLLQSLEWVALDRSLGWRPSEAVDQRILIVGITEEDIRRAGSYPIPDRELAALLRTLQEYQPRVIGLDIYRDLAVEPGHAELIEAFRNIKNLLAVERGLPDRSGSTVAPPPEIPRDRVCLADLNLDSDGRLRRILLGTSTDKGYKFSLSLCLASDYLYQDKILLKNGIRDPIAMRFGSVELNRSLPNSGGYVRAKVDENEMLLNFRSGRKPFRTVSLSQIEMGKVDPNWIRDRIIIIGMTAPSVKDVVNTSAIAGINPGLTYGVEIHAHATSQIISAVLDRRPLLNVWSDGWEYFWVIGWGLLGIWFGRLISSPLKLLLAIATASTALASVSYASIILGWWLPVVPALLALVLTGFGFTAFYRYDQYLKSQIEQGQLIIRERQLIIDHTFDAIHNGPLQTLSQILKDSQVRESSLKPLFAKLERLDRELREVYEAVRKEAVTHSDSLYLGNSTEIDLTASLDKVLYNVYSNAIARDLPCFQTLEIKIYKFDELKNCSLSIEQRRGLCRFLEEALCNVGKHATGVTRLSVTGTQEKRWYVLRIIDNGAGLHAQDRDKTDKRQRIGTQQAEKLARQLGGRFRRVPCSPRGTLCELTWPGVKFRFWRLDRF
jgi:CHASE2 domain-containing sensor protein/two-component sensor histidine kinase